MSFTAAMYRTTKAIRHRNDQFLVPRGWTSVVPCLGIGGQVDGAVKGPAVGPLGGDPAP